MANESNYYAKNWYQTVKYQVGCNHYYAQKPNVMQKFSMNIPQTSKKTASSNQYLVEKLQNHTKE